MLTTILLLLTIGTLVFFWYKRKMSYQKNLNFQKGDIARLKPPFTKDYPSIPSNNVLHILDINGEIVEVEYINFKDGSYHKEALSKKSLIKLRKQAA